MKKTTLMLLLAYAIATSNLSAETSKPVTITFYHTSDLHEDSDSLPRIAKFVNDKKNEGGNILFVNTGDFLKKGDLTPLETKGEAIVEMMAASKYDAIITGNRDYTFGPERLVELIDKHSLPILAANWTGPKNLKPYSIHEFKGVKVGIIGTSSTIKNEPKSKKMKIQPILQSVKDAVKELETKVDIIVLLTHLGVRKDRKLITDIPRLDILLGGHDHKKFSELEFNEKTKTVLQHSGAHGKHFGELTVTWDGEKVIDHNLKLIKVSDEMQPSKKVKAIADKYMTKQDNVIKE